MTNLKEYIDFAISLTEMVEVKSGKFPIPKEIVFNLNKIEHAGLQTQIHDAKKLNKEDCLLYIEKAIKRSDINKVNDSIKKYSPYPEEIIIDKNLVSSYVFNTGTNNILKEIM
jgi:hypothetical protein